MFKRTSSQQLAALMSATPQLKALQATGIEVNAVPYDEEHTDSLANAAHRLPSSDLPSSNKWFEDSMRLRLANPELPSRKIYQNMLGRQLTTVQYRLRNWVWTFSRAGTTVWALINNEGVAWEWDTRGDPKEAFKIRSDVEESLVIGAPDLPPMKTENPSARTSRR